MRPSCQKYIDRSGQSCSLTAVFCRAEETALKQVAAGADDAHVAHVFDLNQSLGEHAKIQGLHLKLKLSNPMV